MLSFHISSVLNDSVPKIKCQAASHILKYKLWFNENINQVFKCLVAFLNTMNCKNDFAYSDKNLDWNKTSENYSNAPKYIHRNWREASYDNSMIKVDNYCLGLDGRWRCSITRLVITVRRWMETYEEDIS